MNEIIKRCFIFGNRISIYLPKYIKLDKIYHFIICFSLSFLFGSYGVVASISAGITKEFADSLNPNSEWSWGDILADFLGIVVGYPLGILFFNGDYLLRFLYNLIY